MCISVHVSVPERVHMCVHACLRVFVRPQDAHGCNGMRTCNDMQRLVHYSIKHARSRDLFSLKADLPSQGCEAGGHIHIIVSPLLAWACYAQAAPIQG